MREAQALPPSSHRDGGRWVLPLAILAHVALSVFLSWNLNIWIDESFSLATTSNGPVQAFVRSIDFELQPPVYFVALSLWREVNETAFFARMFSLLFGVGAIAIGAGLARRWLHGIHPGWFVGCLAINPFLVWTSGEIRLYSLATLLSGLLLLLFHDGFLKEQEDRRAQWLYGLASVAALHTQYYFGFVLVGNAAALVLTGRWRSLGRYLIAMVAVGACFAPMAVVALKQVASHTGTVEVNVSFLRGSWYVVHHVQEMVIPLYRFTGRSWFVTAAALGALSLGVVIFGRKRIRTEHLALWSILCVSTALYVGALFISGPDLVNRRHCAGLFFVGNLVPFSILGLLSKRARRWIPGVWCIAMILFSTWSIYEVYSPLAKEGDWIRISDYLHRREKPGQPILVFPNDNAMPFDYHYSGVNTLVPIPGPMDLTMWDPYSAVLHSEGEIARALNAVDRHHEEIWVVTTTAAGRDAYLGIAANSGTLQGYLTRHYQLREIRGFLGAKVQLFRKRAGTF